MAVIAIRVGALATSTLPVLRLFVPVWRIMWVGVPSLLCQESKGRLRSWAPALPHSSPWEQPSSIKVFSVVVTLDDNVCPLSVALAVCCWCGWCLD